MSRSLLSPEERIERQRTRDREYMRTYRANHPDVIERSRISAARRLLEKAGFTVLPQGDAAE